MITALLTLYLQILLSIIGIFFALYLSEEEINRKGKSYV